MAVARTHELGMAGEELRPSKLGRLKAPRLETICVRVLRQCNLECAHCWAGSSPRQRETLSSADLMRFVQALRAHGLRHVSVSGGEPFMYADLSELVGFCLEIGLCVTVTTNGFMGSRFVALAERQELPKHERLRVRVSIDGPRDVHDALRGAGSHERAVDAVRAVKQHFGWAAVNTVVTHHVYAALSGMPRNLREWEVDEWALMAPLSKGSYRGAAMDPAGVRSAVAGALRGAELSGFRGRIRFWDFQVREHGHLVLESDGRLVMPGFIEESDRIVGDYRSVDIERLLQLVREDAAVSDAEFYSWRGWAHA